MPQEEKTTVVRDGQIDDRYDARCIESKWFETLAAGRVSLCGGAAFHAAEILRA